MMKTQYTQSLQLEWYAKVMALLFASFLLLSQVAQANVSPIDVPGATSLDAHGVKELWMQGALCIDPRSQSDWEAGRIPGALHMMSRSEFYKPETVLRFTAGRYDDPIIAYCNAENCLRAANLARDLVSWGFTNVYYFRDGFPAWRNAQFPYE